MKRWSRLFSLLLVSVFFALLCLEIYATGGVWTAGTKEQQEGESTQDICRIKMTYPIVEGVSSVEDLEEVQEAVNQISRKEIGVEVELMPEDMEDAREDYLLWLSRGDTVDLMLVRDQDIRSFIDKGLLSSMSGFLERNADSIWRLNDLFDGALTEVAKSQGRIYGISNVSGQEAAGYGLWISKTLLEEAEFVYEQDHVYSMDEIDRLLSRLKALYPDSYPLGKITANQTTSSVMEYMDAGDDLGADSLTGVVQQESDVVENLFASGEYQSFLAYMERWYNAGFIYPDSVIYDASVLNLLEDGTVFLIPGSSYPGTMDLMLGEETDFVCLKTTEVTEKGSDTWDFWTVPSTSRYPREAVRFLDLVYRDQRVAYLLNYGISGEHYTISDASNRLLSPVRTDDGAIQGFYNPFAAVGDTRDLYVFGTVGQQREREQYNEEAVRTDNRYTGFSYSTANVSRQIDAVRKVLEIYLPMLESGSVDREKNYEAFLKELQEAGIDEIISDKQEQLNGWLSTHSEAK